MRLLLLGALVSLSALGGRPVFRHLSLNEVKARAQIIAEVEKTGAGKLMVEECELTTWSLVVKRVRKGDLKEGTKLDAVVNPTWLRDCKIRRSMPGTKGASFSAERYDSPLGTNPTGTFVVFLIVKNGRYELVVNGAYESPAKL